MKIQNSIKIQNLKFKITTLLAATLFLTTLLISISAVFAQSGGQFTIGQEVTSEGGDIESPTIPQNLSAAAVSSSEIDLIWDASTDNIGVTGYKIFRDNVEIDTTSLTSYSDTGLNPAASYSYQVSAFDAANNESGLSDSASATTLSDSSGGGFSGSFADFRIRGFGILPDFTGATVKIETNKPSRLTLRWGVTADYEIGSLVSDDFLETHRALIAGLKPDTLYFFEFEVVSSLGQKVVVSNQQFRTLSLPALPLNVSDLRSVGDEEKITLTWKNPPKEFEAIRIIRSDKFFPRDPFDGELVYEKIGETFVDKNVEPEVVYYYAVFVRDSEGNYSSGALTRAKLFDGEPLPSDLFAGVIELDPSLVHPLIKKLTLKDFDFIQDGEKAVFINDNTVLIKGDRILKVSIDYKKLPEVLKTIAIVLNDPEDPSKIFHFLLRVNEDKTAYEASVAPLEREGVFVLGAIVLDHKNRGMARLTGALKTFLPASLILSGPKFPFWPFFWIFLVLIIVFVIWKTRPKQSLKIYYESR